MAKEKPIEENTAPNGGVSATPEEDAWLAGMEGKYPEHKGNREALYKASREGYDREHEMNKQNAEDYGKINEAIGQSPEVAGFMNGILNKEEGALPEESFAAFGQDLVDLLTGKIDNQAYRDKVAANKKAKEDADKAAADEKAKKDADAIKAGEAYVAACEEMGMDPKEAEQKLVEKFKGENGDFSTSKEFYTALLRTLSYDDELIAAEARGRNAQMGERNRRASVGSDGLPRTQSVGSARNAEKKGSLRSLMEQERLMAQ